MSTTERYENWRLGSDGETVFTACLRAALRLRRRGFRHYGIHALWEAARYSHALKIGPDIEGWKLNDHFTSRMARELMEHPELGNFFELRELRTL